MALISHLDQQSERLPVINLDIFTTDGQKDKAQRRHSNLLPDDIRAAVLGPSNFGKTNVALNLLFADNGLKFDNLYIFSNSLHQPKYVFLTEVMSQIPEIGYSTFSNNSEVIPIEEALPNSVFFFDDISKERQDNVSDYFSRGRHSTVDSFYLCQTYSKIPKQLVRDNLNILIIFRQDNRNLKHIFYDHIDPDLTFREFKQLCAQAWNKKHSFVVVNKECPIDKGRYRFGFDEFVVFGQRV